MIVKLYHFEPLPIELRGTLEFPAWPYINSDEEYQEFEEYLKKYQIFKYDDSYPMGEDGKENLGGICIPLHPLKIEQIQESKNGVKCYRSQCVVDPDELTIVEFPAKIRQHPSYNGRKMSQHYDDDWMWEEFNFQGNLTGYNQQTGMIKFDLHAEKLQSLSGKKPRCQSDRSR